MSQAEEYDYEKMFPVNNISTQDIDYTITDTRIDEKAEEELYYYAAIIGARDSGRSTLADNMSRKICPYGLQHYGHVDFTFSGVIKSASGEYKIKFTDLNATNSAILYSDAQIKDIVRSYVIVCGVCDMNVKESVAFTTNLLKKCKAMNPNLLTFLIFNKDDGDFDRVVLSEQEMWTYSSSCKSFFFKCSATEDIGVEDLLNGIALQLSDPSARYIFAGASELGIVTTAGQRKDKKCCVM